MIIKKFEDCLAWQKAGKLTVKIYQLFKNNKDFGFRDQIQRASVSIMNNIAEGLDRKSDNEKRQFLYIAKGSSAEVQSMLYLASKLNYITSTQFKELIELARESARLTYGLIKSIK